MLQQLLLSFLLAGAPLGSATLGLAQIGPPAHQRISQSLIINGQQVSGVLVTDNGVIQSYTCTSPQPYVTADQSSSGWACFDQATGTWLMNAQPPQPELPQQSATIYTNPPVYVEPPAAYGYYPYSYYPYSYSPFFYGAPLFGFGFGFGHNNFNHFGHGHGFATRGFAHGPVIHGPVGHGAIGHGFMGHGAIGHGAIGHGAIGHGAIGHGAIGHGSFGHMGGGGFGHMGGGHR